MADEPKMAELREKTAVAALADAVAAAGDLAHHVDCSNIIFNPSARGRPDPLPAAYRLEADLLDLLLVQPPATLRDTLLLALIADQRMDVIHSAVPQEQGRDRATVDAVHTALMSIAGFLVTHEGYADAIISGLPERLRDDAADYRDNCIGVTDSDPHREWLKERNERIDRANEDSFVQEGPEAESHYARINTLEGLILSTPATQADAVVCKMAAMCQIVGEGSTPPEAEARATIREAQKLLALGTASSFQADEEPEGEAA
jgi:hypothetical protein